MSFISTFQSRDLRNPPASAQGPAQPHRSRSRRDPIRGTANLLAAADWAESQQRWNELRG